MDRSVCGQGIGRSWQTCELGKSTVLAQRSSLFILLGTRSQDSFCNGGVTPLNCSSSWLMRKRDRESTAMRQGMCGSWEVQRHAFRRSFRRFLCKRPIVL